MATNGRPLLVTVTPPTPNGDLHLGHLSGPYLAADVFCRYQRRKGRPARLITSSDDHQSYLVHKAEALGTTPGATADHYADAIERTLRLAAIQVDAFTRPASSALHDRMVGEFFRDLYRAGELSAREGATLYCPRCARYLFDFDAASLCPSCGAGCDGGLCEECGRPPVVSELTEPVCNRCGSAAELRPLRRLFLPLGRFAQRLREYHSQVRVRPHSYDLCQAMLHDGLPDVALSLPSTWGIPVGLPGFDGDVWWGMAEMGPGYVATTRAMASAETAPDAWDGFWQEDEGELVQFFGFDNSYWHLLLHPALLLAHGGYRLPDRFVVNEFYRLDGVKFSSSRGHAVWGSDILSRVPSDAVRYYLCRTAPEYEQTNFTLDEFHETVNRELAGELDAAIERLFRLVTSASPGDPRPHHLDRPVDAMRRRAMEMGTFLEVDTFSIRSAVACWRSMALELAELARSARSASVEGLADMRAAVSIVAGCASPVLPDFAARLWSALGIEDDLAGHRWGEPASPHRPTGARKHPWFGALTPAPAAR